MSVFVQACNTHRSSINPTVEGAGTGARDTGC